MKIKKLIKELKELKYVSLKETKDKMRLYLVIKQKSMNQV